MLRNARTSVSTLVDLIAVLEEWDGRIALATFQNGRLVQRSFAELADQARRFAGGLARLGIGAGDHIVLLGTDRPEWIVACLGIIASGAVPVPLDSQLDPKSLAQIVEDCNPALVITTARAEPRLRDAGTLSAPMYLLDDEADRSWRSLLAERIPLGAVEPDRVAVMFYTSGTTGPPKGVPLSHGNLAFQLRTLRAAELVGPDDRVLLPLPLHHVYPFVIGMLGALVHGVAIVLPSALNGPKILQALQNGRPTVVVGVPRLYQVLLSGMRSQIQARGRPARALFAMMLGLSIVLRRRLGIRIGRWLFGAIHRRLGPAVRLVVSGGAALDPTEAWTMEGLGWVVATGYGLTETSPLVSLIRPGDTHFEGAGRPVPGMEVRIAPTKASARDVEGEIQVHGPGVFAGYRNRPRKTEAAFTPDGWFRTDDLGQLDSDGRLHVLGRVSTMIVTASGKKVQPDDVEQAYEHPAIREIGVLRRNQSLAAVVVPALGPLQKRGETDVPGAIRKAIHDISQRLPSYKRISDVVVSREALDRTRLGKIRRDALERRYDDLKAGKAERRDDSHPISAAEMTDGDRELLENPAAKSVWDWLASRYADRRLTPDSNPALDLGIDSLEWINVTLEVQRITGAEIPEEATARIESVRDLLNEVIEAAKSRTEISESPLERPEAYLNEWQRRWLRPPGAGTSAAAWVLHALNRLVMRVAFRCRIVGRERLPRDGNAVIVPNHASLLDPFVLATVLDYSLLRKTYWAGWTGIAFANPLFRRVSRIARVLPIEQKQAAFSSLALGAIALERGNNLIWFPEGARTRTGELQPFKLGLGMILAKFDVPVVPVFIDGTFDAMPAGRKIPKLRPVRVIVGEPVRPHVLENRGKGETAEARIADALHGAIARLAPHRSHHAPTS